MKIKILTLLVAAIGSVTGLTFATFVWTVRTWAPPSMPMLYLGVAILLLFGLAGVVWFQVTRQELESGEGGTAQTASLERLVGMAAFVVVGAIGLGVAGLWMSPDVRARVIPFASEDRAQVEAALGDPADQVRVEACLKIIEMGVSGSESTLRAALDPHPESALSCLTEAKARKYNGTNRVANQLISGWESQMFGANGPASKRACEYASVTPKARAIAERHEFVGLLTCAMLAESVEVRTCCAQQMKAAGGDSLATSLGPVEEFPVVEGEQMFGALVDHTFRPLSLPVEQQDVADLMDSDAEVNRRWAVEFGCSLVPEPERRRAVVEGMLPIIEGGTCQLSEAAQYAFLEGTQWVFLCDDILLATDVSTEQAICDSFTNSLVERAVAEASSRVYKATRARYLSAAADELEAPVPAGGGGGSSRPEDKRRATFTLAGGARVTGKYPTGSMCWKNEFVVKPGFGARSGESAMQERRTLVPCSQLDNAYEGLTGSEVVEAQRRRQEEALRERLSKNSAARGSGGRKVRNTVNEGIQKGKNR